MNQTEARIFGFFVATMRKQQEWTLEALAHATHFSYSMIRSIEKGTSNIDEEGRNRFARVFGFARFSNDSKGKTAWLARLDELENARASLRSEERKKLTGALLKDRTWMASFLFPQFLFLGLYDRVCADAPAAEIEALRSELEPALEFFDSKELAVYYDLLGVVALDLHDETRYFKQALRYDPESFLIRLHMAMNAYFRQRLLEADRHVAVCKTLSFQVGSLFRFVQVASLEAQIHMDLGDYETAITCLKNLINEGQSLDPVLYQGCLSILAFAYFRKNDIHAALQTAKDALRIGATKPVLHFILVFAAFRLDDPCFAVRVHTAKDALCLTQDSDPFDTFMPWNALLDGIVAWKDENFPAAISLLEQAKQAFSMDPLRVCVLEWLVELAQAQKDFALALQYQKELAALRSGQMR